MYVNKKQYEEYKQYCIDKQQGRILTQDGIRFICSACEYDAEKIGQAILERLGKQNGK